MSTDAQSTLLGDGHSDLGGGSQPPPVAISHSLTAAVDRKPASHGEEQPFATTAGGDAVLDQQGSGRGSSPSANSSAPDTNHGHHPAQSAQLIVPSSIHQPSTSTASCTTQPASQDTVQASQAALERRGSNRRSTIDNRPTSRLSGFFSNLIHRRPDRDQAMPTSYAHGSLPEEPESSTARRSDVMDIIPQRPVTPPPPFQQPTLSELGLSLTAISATLTPTHFQTPPTSGAFLSPHYLLLCHTQGLDVFPLASPPSPQPYALVRRVSFKSVVVMEERGVLVAIAGRRDGVRVYALEEVRKAVEWRIDLEIKREKERLKREEAKKVVSSGVDKVFGDLQASQSELIIKAKLISPDLSSGCNAKKRRESVNSSNFTSARGGSIRMSRKSSIEGQGSCNESDPPPYVSPTAARLRNQPSIISVNQTRTRSGSITNVLAGNSARRLSAIAQTREAGGDEKCDWEHASSDDEAINMATAGQSGSAALDERTSASGSHAGASFASSSNGPAVLDVNGMSDALRRSQPSVSSLSRRNRPAELDVGSAANIGVGLVPPPSPTPTVWTLRQALSSNPPSEIRSSGGVEASDVDNEDEDEAMTELEEPITFAQALMDSRLPGLPPPGTRQPQQAILLSTVQREQAADDSHTLDEPAASTQTLASLNSSSVRSHRGNRRRWSVLDGVFSNSSVSGQIRSAMRSSSSVAPVSETPAEVPSLIRSNSAEAAATMQRPSPRRLTRNRQTSSRAISASGPPESTTGPIASIPTTVNTLSASHHRFLPRIFTSAFHTKRFDDQSLSSSLHETAKYQSRNTVPSASPAPKLEYVKLPGTKGALMIKAVETAKKSFLAILCGDAGEKVELFAGTYRTTLGLSRTFILPDSPRSLELQLQGDDLVEVFLVFSQNVFGLEPATVRVREVRVGRAERRAARRRAREHRAEEAAGAEPDTQATADDELNLSFNASIAASTTGQIQEEAMRTSFSTAGPSTDSTSPPVVTTAAVSLMATQTEELAALAAAQMAPYTTFQQLSFAPQFPLAAIADDCLIPPTYQSFLRYRSEHEPEYNGVDNADLASVQFTPPGLPIPPVLPPSRWFYRDPKGVIQGPWKASLMQTWYKDGLLPPDLPVRREEDIDYILLRDLRAQSVDPSHPFRPPPPPLNSPAFALVPDPVKPLLHPISLLTQPRHYGPPALFFTSRGGHSTSIVDARGRSVLKGRLMWTADDVDNEFIASSVKLGDVKRLETFDVRNGAVIVAVRHGGLEASDIGDALLKPGDLSRMTLPNFNPPTSSNNRRGAYVWRVGSPLSVFASGPVSSSQSLSQPLIKKTGSGLTKAANRLELTVVSESDYESRAQNELLFLGRRDDAVYLCERNTVSFRILRLCPSAQKSKV